MNKSTHSFAIKNKKQHLKKRLLASKQYTSPDLVAVVNAAEAILQSHKNKIQLQKDNYIQWKSLCQDKILFFLDPTQQDFLENISTYPDFFQKIITQAILEQRLVSAIKDLSSFTIFSGKIATYLSSNCKENILNKLIENSTLLTILTANPLQSFTTEIGVMLDKKQKKSLIDQWIVSGDLITKIKQESSPWSFFDSNLAQHLTPEQKQQIQENIKKHLLTELPNGFIDIYFLESHFCKLDRPEQKQILHTIGNSSNPAVIEYFLNWTIDELHSIQIASNTNFEKKANINNSIRALQEIGKGKALREIASIQHTLSELLNTLYLIDEKQVAMTRSDVANTSLAAQKISQLLKLFEPTDPQEQEKNQRFYEQLKTVIGTIKVKQWQTSGILGFFRTCSFNYYRPRETWHTNTADTLLQLWEKGKRLEKKHEYCDWQSIKQQMFTLLEKSGNYSPPFWLGRTQDSITAYDQFKAQIRLIR